MSALAGIVRFDGRAASAADGEAMMDAMARYVADDARTWRGGPAFLGCRIRWITPESVLERMPDGDPNGRLRIVADAILDNRAELFERLEVPSFRRGATTDAELILLAYRRWGRAAPERLVGDFAFMIWDEERRELFGARDLFGSRSLYYHIGAGRLAFATTMAPLLALKDAAGGLDEAWLAEFMAIPEMFESTDAGATPYRGIRQVPPGHSIVFADGRARLDAYGTIEPDEPLRLKSDGEYEEAMRAVFGEAVRCRLRTHREVAATLSGGLDSGAVAGFAARALRQEGKTLQTYSSVPASGFADWTPGHVAADERPYIAATVRHVGNIEETYMDFEGISPLTEVDEWIDLLESPYKFFENSHWLKGIHERAGSRGAGVLLTGARGNFTVSWGPALDYYALLLKRMKWLRLSRELRMFGANKGIGRRRLLQALGKLAFPALAGRSRDAGGADLPAMLIHPDFAERMGVFDRLRGGPDGRSDGGVRGRGGSAAADPFALRRDKLGSLAAANKNGATATKLSLRYGVWERDPTCDLRVVRFCLSVPVKQYVRDGMDRALIRRATKSVLPDEVRLNQRVRGVQGADWIHRAAPMWPRLLDELRRLCDDSAVAGYLHVDRIRAAAAGIGREPRPELAFHPEMRLLLRSVILYRFIKRHA
ncbi:asparagine synthase-related protein [Cohnella nanjingensis]|uniref:asparagine synthase (glutamine-hydrolyzing) n=1 Tax=Cohnella nanjingensis TaxID=1387779 RepID=A0A7X0RS29_9BACL|nr:asparagine synthase-related protein [Cohnella nanjingensis]MBB6671461.1 asparagine synthetase B [Cohnella nanjingensis]